MYERSAPQRPHKHSHRMYEWIAFCAKLLTWPNWPSKQLKSSRLNGHSLTYRGSIPKPSSIIGNPCWGHLGPIWSQLKAILRAWEWSESRLVFVTTFPSQLGSHRTWITWMLSRSHLGQFWAHFGAMSTWLCLKGCLGALYLRICDLVALLDVFRDVLFVRSL